MLEPQRQAPEMNEAPDENQSENQTGEEEKPVGISWNDLFPSEPQKVFTVSGPYAGPGQPV